MSFPFSRCIGTLTSAARSSFLFLPPRVIALNPLPPIASTPPGPPMTSPFPLLSLSPPLHARVILITDYRSWILCICNANNNKLEDNYKREAKIEFQLPALKVRTAPPQKQTVSNKFVVAEISFLLSLPMRKTFMVMQKSDRRREEEKEWRNNWKGKRIKQTDFYPSVRMLPQW